jgi:hypothetical protein
VSITATDFTGPASDAELEALAANLRARNFDVVVVQTSAEAKSAPPRQPLERGARAWTRTLILERDFTPGRTTVILVRSSVGV